jgi:hypothetical protein
VPWKVKKLICEGKVHAGPGAISTPTAKQYNLTGLVGTVHRNEKPVLLTEGSDSGDGMMRSDSNYGVVPALSVEFIYTMGMW